MRILVALDSFKDSLASAAACDAVAEGLRAADPACEVDCAPLSDGGEGFVSVLARACGAQLRHCEVTGPLGQRQQATWFLLPAGGVNPPLLDSLRLDASALGGRGVAVIEMAQAAGLEQVPRDRRDPWQATTAGVGQLLLQAAEAGAGAILVGLGGSATNDLGLGALCTLGLRGQDSRGGNLSPLVPRHWSALAGYSGRPFLPGHPALRLACDVGNPLLGPRGATATFGPQKGLPHSDVSQLDALAGSVAGRLVEHLGADPTAADLPGAGAAGGLAWGLLAGLGSAGCDVQLVAGFATVAAWLRLEERIRRADLVITGEGRWDQTTLSGKGPGQLVLLAARHGKPAWVFAGAVAADSTGSTESAGFVPQRVVALSPPGEDLAESLRRTGERLRTTAETALRCGSTTA